MPRIKSFLSIVAVLFIGVQGVFSLEIPLKRGGSESSSSVIVGFVDMEKIFQEYPETQKAKSEYYAVLAEKRESLAERERELSELREQLKVLKSSLVEIEKTTAPVSSDKSSGRNPSQEIANSAKEIGVSSASVAAVKNSLSQREQALKKEEASLEESQLKTAKDLKEFEKERSFKILGKLYKALVQLADENGISLVVDKSSILYGQKAFDLTEKLNRRIRGLPEDDGEISGY